ncbi:uncharacterized protein LOC134854172 [Symsagittifera roscoffensis]|uniref:uncharacterized protein LOC134854172 n=1 Tax=Symsagittifera roscoffensis TaxID=84072 RepID=UPI00307C057F
MCVMAMLRKVSSVGGLISSLCFVLLSAAFHVPIVWYLETGVSFHVGGLWHFCSKTALVDWKCEYVDKKDADAMGHDWGDYVTMRTFVVISDLIGVALLIFFYLSICIKSKVLGVASVIGAAAVVGLITVSSTLAQTAFTQYNGADTEADWCLYVIWLCFMSTFIVAAFAIAVLVAACMDD